MDASTLTGLVVCGGAVLALLVLLIVLNHRREKARRQALERWAAGHEWQVIPRPEVDWGRRMPGRNKRGVSLAVSGMLHGRPATIAEYSYTTTTGTGAGTTTSTETHHYVLSLVVLRQAHPSVAVYQRTGLSKLGRTLFGDKPTAIGYEPFDRTYRVTAGDPGAVRAVLAPALVNAHVAGQLPMWSLEGRELLSFRRGRIGDPATIPNQLEPLLRVADLIEARR
jgi:hypothetical protein